MITEELLYQVALTCVPNIGDVLAKELLQHFEDARSVFKAPVRLLEKIEGIGTIRARALRHFNDFKKAEAELRFIEKYRITPLFYSDEKYPKRLHNCYDSPVMLYYKGNADLNAGKIVSIIGTRKNTAYGKAAAEQLIEELASLDVTVVSGLAYGIDIIAHRAALRKGLPTVAVLAHGLDRIYPAVHKSSAAQMVEKGGLLTDFMSGTKPDKQNFPRRNRIVAGMADATIVIESGIRGGSLITAAIANSYNRDVFAVPGRIGDAGSEGCNYLVKSNKAALITSGRDLVEMMSWEDRKAVPEKQKELFIELTDEEKQIIALFGDKEMLHVDEIYLGSRLPGSRAAAVILDLELRSVLKSLPGKMYRKI